MVAATDRVWIVDPETQRVHIYRANTEPAVLNVDDVLNDESILPGFSCRVAEFFED
jgi:Uma2 family endonuclease